VYTRTPLHACIPKFPIYLNVYRLQYSTVTWSWGFKGVVVDVGQIKQHFDGFWCVIVVIKRLLICYNTINVVLRCEDRVNPLRKKLFVSDWYRHGKQYSYSSEMNVAVLVWLGSVHEEAHPCFPYFAQRATSADVSHRQWFRSNQCFIKTNRNSHVLPPTVYNCAAVRPRRPFSFVVR